MKRTLTILALLILLCGCSLSAPMASTPPATTVPVIETTVLPTTIPQQTEETVPAATDPPVEYLDVESGAFLLRYTDEESGSWLDYYCYIPTNATKNMPLLVFLHGDGEVNRPESLLDFGPMEMAKEIYAEEFPFIAILPCARIPSWIDSGIPETLMGLISAVSEQYHINQDKIMLSGHSRGAIGVWHLLGLYGDVFSAAVPVSCGAYSNVDFDMAATVPVRAFAGTSGEAEKRYAADMQKAVSRILEVGGSAELLILEDLGHAETCTAAFTEALFAWMLRQ